MTFKDEYGPQFRKAYEFFKKHRDARTEADYEPLLADALAFKTDFEKALAMAVMDEIERMGKWS